jgi:hypothetical protein
MMWIAGVHPLEVLEGFVGSGVALVLFGIPAALAQQRHSPIVKDPDPGTRIDPLRVAIVAFVLIAAIVVNIAINTRSPVSDRFPFLGVAVVSILACAALRAPDCRSRCLQGSVFLLSLVLCVDDAGGLPAASWQTAPDWAFFCRVRQHPAHRPGARRAATTGASGRARSFGGSMIWFAPHGRRADQHVS